MNSPELQSSVNCLFLPPIKIESLATRKKIACRHKWNNGLFYNVNSQSKVQHSDSLPCFMGFFLLVLVNNTRLANFS
jgi:hypothetical protein